MRKPFKPDSIRRHFPLFLLYTAAALTATAQTYTILASFNYTNGQKPASVTQGFDGNFYGTTTWGGTNQDGTVFRVTPAGALAVLHNFDLTDGTQPGATLVQGTDGNLYGTTMFGGTGFCDRGDGCGTVFTITPAGVFTVMHNFTGHSDGFVPTGMVEAANGYFYGVTAEGGPYTAACRYGCGTIFQFAHTGYFATLHHFHIAEGSYPYATLIQAFNGQLYGSTDGGNGTIFQISSGGALTKLHRFTGSDGSGPYGALVQAADGDFYGLTYGGGGASGVGCTASGGCGTAFKITPEGTLTTFVVFDGTNGAYPEAPLVAATDGDSYGVTAGGGSLQLGTIFRLTAAGKLTTLFNCDYTTGSPLSIIQATDGSFYGTTSDGGAYSQGTIFRFSIGLGPFVKTLPAAGPVGTTVHILGNSLTAPATVTFNGTPAVVTSVLPSQIVTTVPPGATTGKVVVTIPNATLTSNTVFQVRQ